jgi:hypothetical protein
MLLQVEQGHVQEIHRLVEARIDLQFLFELCGLTQSGFHSPSLRWQAIRSVLER